MRLFVAVWPSSEVRDVLAGLRRPVHPAVRWTPLDHLHVTLHFLGNIADDAMAEVGDTLREVASARAPRRVELGPSTARLGRRVLIVPATGLDDLGSAVAEALSSFGSFGDPAPYRPFVGHLTLARGRNRSPIPADLAGQRVEASWTVRHVTLVRSHLRSGGVRYEVLASMRLLGTPGIPSL